MMTTGLPSDTCYPYTSGQGDSGTCLSTCKDGSAKMLTNHKIKSWDYVNGEAAMMNALVTGPIAVAFAVYEDFFSYKTGVYVPNKASGLAGYHAVKMVGYGVTTGPKPQKCAPAMPSPPPLLHSSLQSRRRYWIVANSWGLSWGNKGFFQIVRGQDSCGIEYGPLDRGCPIAAVAQ
jgi:cathepsin B